MESGQNSELLRNEASYLAGKIHELLFSSDEAKSKLAIPGVMRVSADVEDQEGYEIMFDYYNDTADARELVPDSMKLPLFVINKSAQPDAYHITPEGDLPGMFVDANGHSCYVMTEYFLNTQGESVRRVNVVNEGEEYSPEDIIEENITRVDRPVADSVSVEPLARGEFEFIGSILKQIENGEFEEPRYFSYSPQNS